MILVTGSTGFIGKNLIKGLLSDNYKVLGISSSEEHPIRNSNFLQERVNITSKKEVENLFAKYPIRSVIHLAALSNKKGEAKKEWNEFYNVNVIGSQNIFKLAARHKTNIIFASTVDVYGIQKNRTVNEDLKVNYVTNYAKSKYLAEQNLIKLGQRKDSLRYTILRIAPVYSNENKIDLYKRFYLLHDKVAFKIGNGLNYHLLSIDTLINVIRNIVVTQTDENKILNIADLSPIHSNTIKYQEIKSDKKFIYLTVPKFLPNLLMFITKSLYKVTSFNLLKRIYFNLMKLAKPYTYEVKRMQKIIQQNDFHNN